MKLTKILKFSRSFACSIVLVAPVLVSAHTALKESTQAMRRLLKLRQVT